MPGCSVFGCSERTGHCFPDRKKSPKRFGSWLEFCKRKSFQPGQNARICRKHFLETDFDESSVLKKKLVPSSREACLKKSAVPSVHIKLLAQEKRKLHKSRTSDVMHSTKIENLFINIQCELSNETIKNNEFISISGETPFEYRIKEEVDPLCELMTEENKLAIKEDDSERYNKFKIKLEEVFIKDEIDDPNCELTATEENNDLPGDQGQFDIIKSDSVPLYHIIDRFTNIAMKVNASISTKEDLNRMITCYVELVHLTRDEEQAVNESVIKTISSLNIKQK